MKFEYEIGATPLDREEMNELIPKKMLNTLRLKSSILRK